MSLRALLIDDDLRLSELLAEYFTPHGVEIVHACDGRQGLAKIEQGGYDVVLLDLTMPGMDGLEVCRRIRERSRIPVVMLTARGDVPDRIAGLDAGADDYLSKPFSFDELLARLRALHRRSHEDAAAGLGLNVDNALREIVAKEGGKTPEQVNEYMEALKGAKRYRRDVY